MHSKIGFFGGTFDPFHLGHLTFIIEMLEKTDLEQIWICPTSLSPFKSDQPPICPEHRLEMVKLGVEGISNIKLIDTEVQKEGVSYTYDTLLSLKEKEHHLTLLLSDNLLNGLDKWHEAEKLIQNFPLLVGQRKHINLDQSKLSKPLVDAIQNKIIPIRLLDISSTEVRTRLKNKLYCHHLLPSKTLDYIYKNKLYS